MPRRLISPEEIVERTICALINEGPKILEEGIAFRSSDLDVIFIKGHDCSSEAVSDSVRD